MPNADLKPLRFVILCNSVEFESWQAACLKDVISSGHAIPVGFVTRSSRADSAPESKWKKRWKNRKLAVWRLFDRFYTRRFSKAIKLENLSNLLEMVPSIDDTPIKVSKGGEALDEATLDFLRDLRPDFILRFSYGILRGDVLDIARYGVWSYHHGDPVKFRGQPPGFWEIVNESSVAGAVLQVLSNELDAGKILHHGFFQVTPQSYAKTRDTLYMGASPWVRRVCADIQLNGWPINVEGGSIETGPIYKQPTNKVMVRYFWITIKAFFRAQFTYRFHRQNWNCAVVPASASVVAGLSGQEMQREALKKAVWMKPKKGEFYADPFGLKVSGSTHIRVFFELFSWKKQKGEIASIIFDGANFGQVTPTLSASTHLSYPYTMHGNHGHLIVPEHSDAGDVSAYYLGSGGEVLNKKTLFPRQEFIDTSFVEWNGTLWAFTLIENFTRNTDLFLFSAKSLDGPWVAHPLNPIRTDIRAARPAGTPFVYEGRLYRPAQDCADHYGSAVTINEIIVLSDTDYREITVSRVEPIPGNEYQYGLHTLSEIGSFTLIDGSVKEAIF